MVFGLLFVHLNLSSFFISNAYNYGSVEFALKFSLLRFDQLYFFRIF